VLVLTDKLNVTDLTPNSTPKVIACALRRRLHRLISSPVAQVAEGARLMVVGAAMKVVRGPAHRAGWTELFDYLEHGYDAFRRMRDVKTFVQLVEQREKRILDQIFSGHPTPWRYKRITIMPQGIHMGNEAPRAMTVCSLVALSHTTNSGAAKATFISKR
jgi:hypothetical protein